MTKWWIVFLMGLGGLTACFTSVGTSGRFAPDTADQCMDQCQSMDMRVGAIVILANNIGCVCEPRRGRAGRMGAAGGMATIMLKRQNDDDR